MYKLLLIRYGELGLKGKNKIKFIEKLAHNMRQMLKKIEAMEIAHFPICIAKTQYSFSTDPKLYGAVEGFEFHIRDIVINQGAEMLVVIAGEILRMPGLPKEPQALHIDIKDGLIDGLS